MSEKRAELSFRRAQGLGSAVLSSLRAPRIDQLDANAGKIADIAGGERYVAAHRNAGDLHIGGLQRPANAAAIAIPLRGSEGGAPIEVQHAAAEQVVEGPVNARLKLLSAP